MTPLTDSQKTHCDGNAVMSRARRETCGFLTETDVAYIAADPATRLTLLLVRCGGGRFLAPADQVQHFITIIEEHNDFCEERFSKGDYVRDVSLPVQGGQYDR